MRAWRAGFARAFVRPRVLKNSAIRWKMAAGPLPAQSVSWFGVFPSVQRSSAEFTPRFFRGPLAAGAAAEVTQQLSLVAGAGARKAASSFCSCGRERGVVVPGEGTPSTCTLKHGRAPGGEVDEPRTSHGRWLAGRHAQRGGCVGPSS